MTRQGEKKPNNGISFERDIRKEYKKKLKSYFHFIIFFYYFDLKFNKMNGKLETGDSVFL
jgi:hypothetical protein